MKKNINFQEHPGLRECEFLHPSGEGHLLYTSKPWSVEQGEWVAHVYNIQTKGFSHGEYASREEAIERTIQRAASSFRREISAGEAIAMFIDWQKEVEKEEAGSHLSVGDWALAHKSGELVLIPYSVEVRGTQCEITGGSPPHKPSSEGKVHGTFMGELYPSVFDMKWVKNS